MTICLLKWNEVFCAGKNSNYQRIRKGFGRLFILVCIFIMTHIDRKWMYKKLMDWGIRDRGRRNFLRIFRIRTFREKNYKRFCEELLKLLTTWPAPLKFRQQNSGVRSAARREKKKERLLTRFQESFKILDLHPLLRSCTVLYLCAGLKILTDTTQLKDLQVKS